MKPGEAAASRGEGEVTVMTSYEARAVGGDCVYVLETSYTACQQVTGVIESSLILTVGNVQDRQLDTDLLKLSLFSKFGEGGTFGTECLHQMARKCNVWPQSALRNCTQRLFRPNFLLLDYPNYGGNAATSVIQLCAEINYERARTLARIRNNTSSGRD